MSKDLDRRKLIKLGLLLAGGSGATRAWPHRPTDLSCHDRQTRRVRDNLIGSTVLVDYSETDALGKETHGHGTGFHIGDGLFITNRHVVFRERSLNGVDVNAPPRGRILVGHPAHNQICAHDIDRFNGCDLALIKTSVDNYAHIPITSQLPDRLAPVHMCTYQGDTLFLRGRYAIHNISGRYLGTLPFIDYQYFPRITHIISTDFQPQNSHPHIRPGASGSPVTNMNGEAFGVITSHNTVTEPLRAIFEAIWNIDMRDVRNIALAVPLQFITVRNHLESHGIQYR